MPLLINQALADDVWTQVTAEALAENPSLPEGDVIVPLAYYLEQQAQLAARAGRVGVLVNGDDDLPALFALQNSVPLVAIEFPVFRDGRGFSIARQLVRNGFDGEIRAVGDVAHDRLAYMRSVGFNAFQIPEARFSEADLSVFDEISVNYQGTVADPRPVFRR